MSTFCTTNNNLKFSTTSLNKILSDCNNNIITPDKNQANSFNYVFGPDEDNQLLSRACGIPAPVNIFNARKGNTGPYPFNNNVPNAPDQATFYNFWGQQNQIVSLYSKIIDLFASRGNNQLDDIYTNLNNLFGALFYFFLCTASPTTGDIPKLSQDDKNVNILNNWRFFLSNLRGISSINTCNYCLEDYLLPSVKNKPSNAGGIVRNLLANNPFLRGWCGCCIPQSDKINFGGVNYDFSNPFINKTNLDDYPLYCEPVCNTTGELNDFTDKSIIIPLIEGDPKYVNAVVSKSLTSNNYTYLPPTCNNTICVISDIAIDTIATKGKGINFNQVCPGCAKPGQAGKCTCYSYGNNVIDKISSGTNGMQDPATFKQECPNSFCFEEQSNGRYKEIKCNSVNPGNTGKVPNNNYNGNGLFNDLSESNIYGVDTWLFPISLLIILIILFLGAIFVTVYRNRIVPRKRQEN